jgi:hypothetical protein
MGRLNKRKNGQHQSLELAGAFGASAAQIPGTALQKIPASSADLVGNMQVFYLHAQRVKIRCHV